MKRVFAFVLLLSCCSAFSDIAEVKRWMNKYLHYEYVEGTPDPLVFSNTVQIAENVTMDLVIEVSNKGRGFVSIGGQKFYIRGGDGEMAEYDDGYLEMDMEDFNGDGYKDLIFSGVVNYFGEFDWEVYEQESVVFIYYYVPEKKRFELKYKKASYDLTVNGDASTRWEKRYFTGKKYEKFRKLDHKKEIEFNRKREKGIEPKVIELPSVPILFRHEEESVTTNAPVVPEKTGRKPRNSILSDSNSISAKLPEQSAKDSELITDEKRLRSNTKPLPAASLDSSLSPLPTH